MPKKVSIIGYHIEHECIDKIKFGAKIGNLMALKGFTNESFAEASGISVTTIKEIKYGRRLPSLQKYLWIIETLGVSDVLPLNDFISKDCETVAKQDIIKNDLLPLLETMSVSQLESFVLGVKNFSYAMKTDSMQHLSRSKE